MRVLGYICGKSEIFVQMCADLHAFWTSVHCFSHSSMLVQNPKAPVCAPSKIVLCQMSLSTDCLACTFCVFSLNFNRFNGYFVFLFHVHCDSIVRSRRRVVVPVQWPHPKPWPPTDPQTESPRTATGMYQNDLYY